MGGGFRSKPYHRRASLFARLGPAIRFIISAVGFCGFLGLLVASHYVPAWATPLRVTALVVFISIGLIKLAPFWRR
jgi:hypothetical protein